MKKLFFGVISKKPFFSKFCPMILRMNSQNPQKRYIAAICEFLKKGEIIGYPTDTQYGFGCSLFSKKAIEKLATIKRQPKNKPFSFICNGLSDISKYARVSNFAYRTMKRLLPGPYTFILPSTSLVPKIMMTKQRTVGIRVPDNNIALSIIEELGHPIVNTTAVLSDKPVFYDPIDIHNACKNVLGVVVDDGNSIIGDPSTVIDLTNDEPAILRQGKGNVDFLFTSL